MSADAVFTEELQDELYGLIVQRRHLNVSLTHYRREQGLTEAKIKSVTKRIDELRTIELRTIRGGPDV